MTDLSAAAPAALAKASAKAIISAWFNANIGGSPQMEDWQVRKHLREQLAPLAAALDAAGADKDAISKAIDGWFVSAIHDSPVSRDVRALAHLKERLPELAARAAANS